MTEALYPAIKRWTWAHFADPQTLLACGERAPGYVLATFRRDRQGVWGRPDIIPSPRVCEGSWLGRRLLIDGLEEGWTLYDPEEGQVIWRADFPARVRVCQAKQWLACSRDAYRHRKGVDVLDVRTGEALLRVNVGGQLQDLAVSSRLGCLLLAWPWGLEVVSVPDGQSRFKLAATHTIQQLRLHEGLHEVACGGSFEGQPLTRVVRLDSAEAYLELDAAGLAFSEDGTRALAGNELLGLPGWRSYGRLGGQDASFAGPGVLSSGAGRLELWDLFGEFQAGLEWDGSVPSRIAAQERLVVTGGPQLPELRGARAEENGWQTWSLDGQPGYPVLSADGLWLTVLGAETLWVSRVEDLRTRECSGCTASPQPGTVSFRPVALSAAGAPTPEGYWRSVHGSSPGLYLGPGGEAHVWYGLLHAQRARWEATGETLYVYHHCWRLLGDLLVHSLEGKPVLERFLPQPPAEDPLDIAGVWEDFEFLADGTFRWQGIWSGTWGLEAGGWVARGGGTSELPLSRPVPHLLSIGGHTVSRLPTAKTLWGRWQVQGCDRLPPHVGFTRRLDDAGGVALIYDADSLRILGEYDLGNPEPVGFLRLEDGELGYEFKDADQLAFGGASGRATRLECFQSEPVGVGQLVPSPTRQAAWDQALAEAASRKADEAQRRYERARDRNPYLR